MTKIVFDTGVSWKELEEHLGIEMLNKVFLPIIPSEQMRSPQIFKMILIDNVWYEISYGDYEWIFIKGVKKIEGKY